MTNPNEFLCPICQKYPENNCSKCNKIKQALENQTKEFEGEFEEKLEKLYEAQEDDVDAYDVIAIVRRMIYNAKYGGKTR